MRRAVVVGFCFGGAQAFHASTRDDIGLDAVVGFYGHVVAASDGPLAGVIPAPRWTPSDMKRVPNPRPVGGDDAGIRWRRVTQFEEALDGAGGPDHEIIVYPGAPAAVLRAKLPRRSPDACDDAWRRVLDFLSGVGSRVAG